MGFGERLQRAREMRGISLDEMAEATKIGSRSLRALEEEKFDILPGGIFNKGFVRAYARYLGIDEEQAVADYLAASGEPEQKEALAPEELQKLNDNWQNFGRRAQKLSRPMPWSLVAVLAIVVVAVLLAAWRFGPRARDAYRQSRTPQQQETALAVPPSAATSATSEAPQTPPPAPEPEAKPAADFVVVIRARESSYVSLKADGQQLMRGTLSAGGETTARARGNLVLYTENAGGLDVTFNGKPEKPLGTMGEKRAVIFTSAGRNP